MGWARRPKSASKATASTRFDRSFTRCPASGSLSCTRRRPTRAIRSVLIAKCTSRLSSFASATVVLALARTVAAQACCVSAAAHEFAVVGRYEDAVLVSELGYERCVCSDDSAARYHRLKGAEVDDGVLTIG